MGMLKISNYNAGTLLMDDKRFVIQPVDNNVYIKSETGTITTTYLIPKSNDIEIYVRSTLSEYNNVVALVGKQVNLTGDYTLSNVILSKIIVEKRLGNSWIYWRGVLIQ
jgi:hypothetical protein